MNKLFRALIAGWTAKKLGGGCISTIIVFVIVYYALGTCNRHPVQTAPAGRTTHILPAKTPSPHVYVLNSAGR